MEFCSLSRIKFKLVMSSQGFSLIFLPHLTPLKHRDACMVWPNFTHDMTLRLMMQFIEEEVREAICQMNPLGSPGSDGFPAQFYQSQWDVVVKDIYNFTLHILK